MVRRAEQIDRRRGFAAVLLFAVSLLIVGCADDSPAYVVNPDRSISPYPEHRHLFTVIVREGDSLSVIAQRCDTNVETIVQLNGLGDNHTIYPGEELSVPTRPREATADKPHSETLAHDDEPRSRVRPEPRRERYDAHQASQASDTNRDDGNSWWSWWTKPSEDSDVGTAKFIWPVEGHVIESYGSGDHGERNDGINIA